MSVNKQVSEKTIDSERESLWESMSERDKRSIDACCWHEGFDAGFRAAQEYFLKMARA